MKGKLQNSPVWVQVAVWLGIMAVLTVSAMGIWLFIPDGQGTNGLKWLQFLQTLGTFLFPALIAAYLWSSEPMRWLHLQKGMTWQTAIIAVLIMVFALPGINLLSYCNQQLSLPESLAGLEQWMKAQEDAAAVLTERFLQVSTAGGLLLNLGLMALLPALAEELTFRGVVQGLFRGNRHVAIWCTAFIFSFIHFQFYGFVPRMLMGALFGYMLWWTGSLWVPVLMHFTNNALAVVFSYLVYNHKLPFDADSLESIGTFDTLWLGILSIGVVSCTMLFYRFYILRKQYGHEQSNHRM